MSHAQKRGAALFAALISLCFAAGTSAQSTAPQPAPPPSGKAVTPAPPAPGSTGMDKGAGTAAKAAPAGATIDRGDRRFLEKAARGGMAEVELGKLAQDKGSHADVKAFGKRMADDHGKAGEEVKRIAGAKGVALPSDLASEHKRMRDRLAKLSGAEFDRVYMKFMVDDHSKDLRDFRSTAKSAKDADVKGFAGATLPTLEEHLKLAKATEATVRGAGRDASKMGMKGATGAGGPSTTGMTGPGTGMPSASTEVGTSAPKPAPDGATGTGRATGGTVPAPVPKDPAKPPSK